MVYVKDELIKFEADRINTTNILMKTKKDIEILEKTTTMQFNRLEIESLKEKTEFNNKIDTKFADLEKELAMLVTESNIHTDKQDKLTSSHNNLNYKVLNFLTENERYRA